MSAIVWDNCIKVLSSESMEKLTIPESLKEQVNAKTSEYLDLVSDQIQKMNRDKSAYKNYSVWYDLIDGLCFSGCQFNEFRMFGKDQNFYTTRERFLDHCKSHYLKDFYGEESTFDGRQIIGDPNSDFLYSNPELFEKYSGKSIMIVGGGPSTRDVAWENLETDYIWTCNEFYKNEKFANKKVDLVSLAPLVDARLLGSPLEQFFADNEDVVAAFPADRSGLSAQPVLNFAAKYPDQSCLYHTRYGSVLGVMNRLICLAIFSGARKIYFVGMDGRNSCESNGDLLHAFDGDKPVPTWYQNFGDRFQIRQFVVFYDYLFTLQRHFGYNFQIYNLGEGHEYNVSTNITRQVCPLTNQIKERVSANG